jgi:ribosomal protein L37AE/L43A
MRKKDYHCPRCTIILDLKGVLNIEGYLYVCEKCGYKFGKMTFKPYE